MINIPVEFMPGFWISLPAGLEKKGSGFLLAENIKSVFSINCKIPSSNDLQRSWSIISLTESELQNPNYMKAFIRIISESWVDTRSIIIIGNEISIVSIIKSFLIQVGGIKEENTMKIILSKI